VSGIRAENRVGEVIVGRLNVLRTDASASSAGASSEDLLDMTDSRVGVDVDVVSWCLPRTPSTNLSFCLPCMNAVKREMCAKPGGFPGECVRADISGRFRRRMGPSTANAARACSSAEEQGAHNPLVAGSNPAGPTGFATRCGESMFGTHPGARAPNCTGVAQ
jgi:hypothetical protein